ncbi:hypothetical protein HpCK61_12280 [Helicobacter pylori]
MENKERFLEQTRQNSDERLAALNLVEPIREPHIEIFTKLKITLQAKKNTSKRLKMKSKHAYIC